MVILVLHRTTFVIRERLFLVLCGLRALIDYVQPYKDSGYYFLMHELVLATFHAMILFALYFTIRNSINVIQISLSSCNKFMYNCILKANL